MTDLTKCLFCGVDNEIGNGLCHGCDNARQTLDKDNTAKRKLEKIVRDVTAMKNTLAAELPNS